MSTAIALAPKSYGDLSPSFCRGQSDIQSGLMVVATVAAVLSLIPPCRS
jgi:hypothetical protein